MIKSVNETHTVFFKNGLARKVAFSIELIQITTPQVLKNNALKAAGKATLDTAAAYGIDTSPITGIMNAGGCMMNERITALIRQGKTVLYAGATTLNLFIDDMARTLERAYPQPIGATISLLVMV